MNGLALFAGVAGLDLGVRIAIPSGRTICYVEGEAYAASVLVSQMEKGGLHPAPIWSNVATFDGIPWSGKVDFITAGFPCQPWSKAGKLKKTEDERWLWEDIERIICEVRPQFLFLENVPGIINGGISHILESLAERGFNVEWGCLKASKIGANHHRDRAFIFAYCAERGCTLSDYFSDGFFSRWEHDKKSCEGEFSERRMEGDQSSLMREALPNSQRFLNGYRRLNKADKEIILRREVDPTGSNRDKSRLQSSQKEGSHESNLSDSHVKRWNQDFKNLRGGQSNVIRGSHKGAEIPSIECPSWWKTEPSVGRVVDGLAHRVDRLRACGNGVVPLQAGVAYSILISRAVKGGA